MTSRKRVVALMGLLAVVFAGIWIGAYRKQIALPLCRMWAAYECRSGSAVTDDPSWAFRQLLGSGEAG